MLAVGAMLLSACSGSAVANNWHGLAADAEHAYVSAGSFIYAVDLRNGSEVWRYPEKADSNILYFANPVLTEDGHLLIGSAGAKDHKFISLDPSTGKENWAQPFTGAASTWIASPLVLNGMIYAPNADGFLYILNLDGTQAAEPIEIGGALWAAPVTDGNLIYLSSLDHFLHIIDPQTNSVKREVDLGGAIPSSPAVGEQGAYIGSFSSTIDLVTADGDLREVSVTSNRVWSSPVIDNGILYYADLDGNVYSFDLGSEKQNWTVKPGGPVAASPLVAGGQIYVASEEDPTSGNGALIALDLEGRTLWSKDTGGKMYTAPVATGELILAAPYQGETTLIAYDADGKLVWSYTPEK